MTHLPDLHRVGKNLPLFPILSKAGEKLGSISGEAFYVRQRGRFNLTALQVPIYETEIIMHPGLPAGGEDN